MGVSLVEVGGRYRAGMNSDEAAAMIDAALRFMRSSPHRSLGLVTLNQKQRDLLLEEWERALSRDIAAANYVEDWAQRNDGLEQFFIKNLENVQGDERDVIFIGTVYGPEQPGGPVLNRFGPISGLAGRRRLNVLFSRAKEQIVTFTSMTAADIKADDNGNPGAFMLKRWLEYSATGKLSAGEDLRREPESEFEVFVIEQLRSMGCEPVPQVGVAGFRIDIGVMHPSWPHGYIMGVECDGATYHSSRSARDRDQLREQVLNGLGWHLYRIWSTDWFNDPNKQAARLRAAVEERLSKLQEGAEAKPAASFLKSGASQKPQDQIDADLEEQVESPSPPQAQMQPAATEARGHVNPNVVEVGDTVRVRYLTGEQRTREVTLSDTLNKPEDGIVHMREPLAIALIGAEIGEEIEVLTGHAVRPVVVEGVTKGVDAASNSERADNVEADGQGSERPDGNLFSEPPAQAVIPFPKIKGNRLSLDAERFYEPGYLKILTPAACEIVDEMGPITFRHLSESVARAHGFQRTGSQIKKQVWSAVSKYRRSSRAPNGEVIFWPRGSQPAAAVAFRGSELNGEHRDWQHVPYPEKLGLALQTIGSRSSGDLAGAMASKIGLSRLKQSTRDELEALLDEARKHGSEVRGANG